MLVFGPWRRSAPNMGFVDKWPPRMQRQWFYEVGWAANNFWLGPVKSGFSGQASRHCPNLPPPKSSKFVGWDLTSSAAYNSRFWTPFKWYACLPGRTCTILKLFHQIWYPPRWPGKIYDSFVKLYLIQRNAKVFPTVPRNAHLLLRLRQKLKMHIFHNIMECEKDYLT